MKKVFITALALLLCITTFAQRGNDSGQNARKNVSLVVTQPANLYGGMHNIPAIVSRTLGQRSNSFYFQETFDVSGLSNWGNIDADGDGHTWQLAAGQTGNGAQSVSWSSATGSLNPDNWLISSEITIPATAGQEGPVTLSWYVQSGSNSYPEHYGVYVSTTGDQPANFTTQIYDGQSPSTSWTQMSVDFSDYVGQTVRIAFRHFNSYDKWSFTIDDVEIYEYVEPEPVVCDPITTFPYFNDFEDFNTNHDCWIDIDNDGDGYGWFTDTDAYWGNEFGVDGSNCLVSQSYENYVGARDADNYLLSPEFELPADGNITLSWFEQSQDPGFPDSYEVMIAPNGSTDISDFVSIYSGVAANPWTERTADISAYAGTTVRVVFHHQSSDCYFLEIDNMSITVEGGPEPSNELTIYADATDTQRYAPVYTYYGDTQNSAAQFVAPASLLTDMVGKQITRLKFYTNPAQAYNPQNISGPTYAGYMTEVASETLSTFIDFNSATNVFNGNISLTDDCLIIDLATPYTYNGGNLAIAFVCTTSASYCSTYYYSVAATGGSIYRNSATATPGVQDYLPKTTFTYSGGVTPQESQLSVAPDPVDFGYRPNNCWMRPMVVTVTNDGPATQIFGIDVDNNYFVPSLDEEMAIPFALGHGESFNVNFGWTTAAEGEVNGVLAIDNQNRLANLFDITAYAYEPVEPDVWEMARVVSNPEDYRDTPTTVTLYDNYLLPPTDVEDGNDAVYKVTFDHDVMLNGNVVTVGGTDKAENGKMAVYREGFEGVGGPDLNNNYTGPTVASSLPMTMTAYPDGTTTVSTLPMYGLYADAYTRSQYVIPATEIAQMAGCPINSLTYYTESNPTPWQSNFQVYLTEVNYTTVSSLIDPATATTVYTGQLVVADGMMHIDFATPYQYNGGNLLIGMDCLECNNYSSCYFKAVSMTGAGMYAYNYSAPTFTSPYTVNYAPTTTFGYMGRSRNRDGNVLTYDFEDGNLQGWTSIDADGDGHVWMDVLDYGCYSIDYAHTGSHSVVSASYDLCGNYDYVAFDANNYLVSPQKYTIAEGSKLSFWYDDAEVMYGWPDYFEVCVSTAGNTSASDFTAVWNSGRTSSNGTRDGRGTRSYGTWREVEVDLSAYAGQEIYIAFHHQQYDGYDLWIDDVTIDLGGTPGPTPVPGDQLITNMTMLPGTYYIAASSTADAWDVILNASELPCPDEITAEANCVEPADDSDGIDPSSVTLKWHLSPYTTEYRLVFGSTYYCENVLVDWTRDLADSYTVTGLFNNTNYFWRIEERNDGCPQGIQGPVWGFTTTFNAPTNLHSANANGNMIYEGETLSLAWNPIVDRTFRSYNIYMDGELIGSTPSNPDPTATTTFDVEGLTYTYPDFHIFNVTAVYDEGESGPSNDLIIAVSGESEVNGHVYELDGVTGIAGATVTMTGIDEFGRPHTYTFTTDENGYYQGAILVGEYNGVASCDGYQDVAYDGQIGIIYGEPTDDIDYIMDEVFAPVSQVIAEYYPDPEDPESPYVKVYWSFAPSTIIEDFETGDFSRFEWNIPAQYPFEITTTNPYEGTYCMQSTNYNVASSTSSIDVNVEIPRDGLMSFYKRISCESSWDMAYFYMDGVQMATFTGTSGWGLKEVAVTEGVHNFKWAYTKDGSVNSGEDRFFIDYIDFIHDAQPVGPGWHTYLEGEFDNAYRSLSGTPSWGYEYPASVISSYAGMTMTKVALFSDDMYGAVGGTFTCNVYQGGATPAAGTLVSSITVDVPVGVGDWVEFDLTTPVHVTNEPLYVLWTADVIGGLGYPAGCASHTSAYGDWWNEGDGTGWMHKGECTWTMKNYFAGRNGRGFWTASENANQAIQPVSNLDSHLRTFAKGEIDNGSECINPNATFKATAKSADRELLYYRVYRTDCYNDGPYTFENTVVCCCELHDTLYIDVEWPELDPGVYKWGVGCVYGGNRESEITWANVAVPAVNAGVKVTRDGDMVYDFENGLQGWTTIDADGDGEIWRHSSESYLYSCEDFSGLGHNGSNSFAYSQSYSMCTYDSYDVDNYLVSPQAYSATANTEFSFFYDFANSWYPDYFEVCVSTVANPTSASDFTSVWNSGAKNGSNGGEKVLSDHNRYGLWTEATVNLSAYAGQNIWIAIRHTDYDMIEVWIDDVTVSGLGSNPGPTPDPSEIQEPRESPIVWSNCLDKDMYLNGGVDITVLLNSADSPEGVEVSFTNLNAGEQELYPVAPVTLDGTGYYVWDTFRRGDYVVSVTNGDAYEPITDTVRIWDATSLRYVMIEIIYGVSDLYVSHTGWAMWGGEGPTPVPPHGDEFTFGFEEDPIANGWTIQQLNETSWVRQEGATGFGAAPHEGNYHMWLHWAYGDQDEWLITPEFTVPANGNLNFWTYANLGSTYGDHYYAKITVDGGNTWNVLWDASAQPAGTNYYTSPINCDLSAYAGQTAKIAWQGVMADGLWYAWCIDDITVSGGREVISFDGRQWFRQETNTTEVGEPVAYSKAGDVEPRNGERHLEGYKVLCTSIDGEPIFSGNTVNPFIQVDTDELVEGENYICKVAAIYSTGMSDWTEAIWQYKSCENYGEAQDVVAEGQNVSWNYPAGPVPPPPGPGDEFTEGFESGSIPTGWTTIDADGDGFNWTPASVWMAGYLIPAHSGADCITSASYYNYALTPDNYLVSPQVSITNGSTFSFWACAQDPSYAAEHYGVAISTTGNTNAADFTTIAEWTMTAKDAAEAGAYMSKNGKGTREGNWYQKTVDLSAYAGQQVYIAIRHFNCTDMFYLNVDDAELSIGAKSSRDVIAFNGFVTDPGAMANGADASWIKGSQSTWGPNVNNGGGYMLGDSFTLNAATTIEEIEVYGYQTGSTTTSTFTGLYAQIYNGNPMNGGTAIWGDMSTNIMTATAFTNCYRGSDGETTATTRPIMSITASGLNINLEAGTYYLVYSLAGTGSSGPWGAPHAEPGVGNTGAGIQYTTSWVALTDSGSGETYGCAMKISGNGGTPVPPTPTGEVLGAMIFRDGEWLAEVAYPTNSYTDEEAYGEHEYCVRIIYNGTNILPDQNEYYSMSCPVCDGEPVGECAPGAPIRGEYVWNNAEDFGALISWGAVPPTPGDTEFTEDFENGLNGWNVLDVVQGEGTWIHSDDNLGGYDYTAYAHSGTGFAMGYSFVDYVGSFNIDSYLYTPQKYSIVNGSTLTFWADNANDSYPENFSVCIATADNPTAADFTQVWAGGAKGGNAAKSDNRHNGIRIDNWRQHTIDLSAYAGQNVYIAFHDVNYDMYEIWIDDVELTVGAKSNRAGELVKYNVYRSADNVEYEFIGSVDAAAGQEYYEYFDATAAGTYYYQVRAEYSDGCESEPAVSEANPANNYVIVIVTSVAENGEIALYPNPTNGNITIQAQNMNRITVVSVLGQVVYDAEVEGDSQIINMAQFNAGVYMVRIATENGVSTQRVTVVK